MAWNASAEVDHVIDGPAGTKTSYVEKPDDRVREIRIRVGAEEVPKLADVVLAALLAGLDEFGSRRGFAGDVRVVIPANSPETVRAQLPGLRETLEGAALASTVLHGRALKFRVEEEGRVAGAGRPILPCLKEASWRGDDTSVCRPLWLGDKLASMPWLAFGYDEPHTFSFLSRAGLAELGRSEAALEREAIVNLGRRRANWEPMDVKLGFLKKLRMLVCGDDFLAAERILDHFFMARAHASLRAPVLAVGVPRRGVIMATNLDQAKEKLAAFATAVAGQFRRADSAPISPGVFVVKDGTIVGAVDVSGSTIAGEPEEDGGAGVTTVVVRNEAGGHDVHILAGGDDFERLSQDVICALAAVVTRHDLNPEFSGLVKVVILGHTPASVRKELPRLEAHLRGIALETDPSKRLMVRLEQQAG